MKIGYYIVFGLQNFGACARGTTVQGASDGGLRQVLITGLFVKRVDDDNCAKSVGIWILRPVWSHGAEIRLPKRVGTLDRYECT